MLVEPETESPEGSETRNTIKIAEVLREALHITQNHNCELMVRAVAGKLAKSMVEQVLNGEVSQTMTTLMNRLSQTTIRAAATHALASAHVTVASPGRHHSHLHPEDISCMFSWLLFI